MENRINIGELDTLVIVQSVTQTRGARGENQTTFTEYSKVYAKVEKVTSEMVNDENLEAGRSISLTIYKIPALSTRWRIVISGTPYEIRSIDTISRISPLCTLSLAAIEG